MEQEINELLYAGVSRQNYERNLWPAIREDARLHREGFRTTWGERFNCDFDIGGGSVVIDLAEIRARLKSNKTVCGRLRVVR